MGVEIKNGEWNNHSPPLPLVIQALPVGLAWAGSLQEMEARESWGSTLVRGLRTCHTSFFNWTWLGKKWGNGGPGFSKVLLVVAWAEAGHCALCMLLKEL